MISYNKRLQDMFHEFERTVGRPGTPREAVEWGLRNGRLTEPLLDPKAALIADVKTALRAETRTDAQGREYRANAALTFTNDGGVQDALWGDIDLHTTPRDHVIEHFGQRRKGIVDDCVKLKADLDHYNDAHREMEQLPLILDFSDDVAEREAIRRSGRRA